MQNNVINPYKVLAAAIIPGAGHVLLGLQQRGLMFLFFTIILGWVSTKIMPAEFSFFSRHAGGVFLYGMSILDAYKIARIRHATAVNPTAPSLPTVASTPDPATPSDH